MADDPRWPRASAWLAGDHHPDPVARLAVMDLPMDAASLSKSKASKAPKAVRKALARFSTWDGQHDIRAIEAIHIEDSGLVGAEPGEAVDLLRYSVQGIDPELIDWDRVKGREPDLGGISADAFVFLGGDNSITRPGVHALGLPLTKVGLLTLDAHFDLRDTSQGLSNGNPIRALLEDGLPGENVVQVGIQPFANSPEYAEVAREAGITFVLAEEVRARGITAVATEALAALEGRADAIYVDLDVDVLDRAFAPACPGSRPGGLTPADLRTAARLAGAHPKVRAVDLVEVDPTRDVADVTVMATAAALLSFAAGLATRG